jgi:hypothetical protein
VAYPQQFILAAAVLLSGTVYFIYQTHYQQHYQEINKAESK